MMRWLEKCKYSPFIAFCLVAIAMIVACNIWSLCMGHCVINDFLRIPLMGWAIILANLVAALIFFLIKRRNKVKTDGSHCASCHSGLQDSWVYCPNCGNLHPI